MLLLRHAPPRFPCIMSSLTSFSCLIIRQTILLYPLSFLQETGRLTRKVKFPDTTSAERGPRRAHADGWSHLPSPPIPCALTIVGHVYVYRHRRLPAVLPPRC